MRKSVVTMMYLVILVASAAAADPKELASCAGAINRAVESLKVVDDFGRDSKSDYAYSTHLIADPSQDGGSGNPWKVQNGWFVPTPEAQEAYCWTSKKVTLAPGQAVAIDISIDSRNLIRVGMEIGGSPFLVGDNWGGRGLTVFNDNSHVDWDLRHSARLDDVTILVVRGRGDDDDKLHWYAAVGEGAYGKGVSTVEDLPDEAPVAIAYWLPLRGLRVRYDNFRHGVPGEAVEKRLEKIADSPPCPWSEVGDTYNYVERYRTGMHVQKYLPEQLPAAGPVKPGEIAAFKKYVTEYPLCAGNYNNDLLYGPTCVAQQTLHGLYEITGDLELLNLEIAHADAIMGHRNDPETSIVYISGDRHPDWPHYFSAKYKNGKLQPLSFGVSDYAVLQRAGWAMLDILKRKDLWDKKCPVPDKYGFGRTYRDRAETYLEMTIECYDNLFKYTLRPDAEGDEKYIMRFPDPRKGQVRICTVPEQWWGNTYAYNRWFGAIVALPLAARSMEILDVHPDKVRFYDKVVQASWDHLLEKAWTWKGKYGEAYAWKYIDDPGREHTEQVAHAAADLRQIYEFYVSGRYDMKDRDMRRFANTILNMHKGGRKMSTNVDGTGPVRGFRLLSHYVVYGEFRPEIYEIFIPLCAEGGTPLTRLEVLRYRARKFGLAKPDDDPAK